MTVARRFENSDEDEQPSYYLPNEVQSPGATTLQEINEKAFGLQDLFGAVVYLTDGTLSARPTARIRQIVDDVNQQSPPPQSSVLRFCPEAIGGESQQAMQSAGARFGFPLQNPLNPFGARLQTLWREIDQTLSRTDPGDFNLDVEQMFWAPFQADPIFFDEFDQVSLFLSHSEWRPETCVSAGGALPSLPNSGLVVKFEDNYAHNMDRAGVREKAPRPHAAYEDKVMTILPGLAIIEPNSRHSFLELPKFEEPYFVWRDETSMLQGAQSGVGRDTQVGGNSFNPYILSPFLTGRGRFATKDPSGALVLNSGAWDNRNNFMISRTGQRDMLTGGLVGAVALPLLADFWTYPDSASKPLGNPFRASGINGWQVALGAQSSFRPNFRAYTAGGLVGNQPQPIDPAKVEKAVGGLTPQGATTPPADNTVFWMMTDYLKRMSVATAGFVELLDPHRMPSNALDSRLGPYFNKVMPAGFAPNYVFDFDPPISELPGGTTLVAEFRGAGEVDTLGSRMAQGTAMGGGRQWLRPTAQRRELPPRPAEGRGRRHSEVRRSDPGRTAPEHVDVLLQTAT